MRRPYFQLLLLLLTPFLAALALSVSASASAQTIVLDNTNGYSVALEPGVVLSRPGVNMGAMTISGGEFAIGTSDTAVFPGQTLIGNGVSGGLLGGNRPRDLVAGATPFTIRASGTGNLYDATLTYWNSTTPAGTPPVPDNAAAAVLDVTLAPTPGVPISWLVPTLVALCAAAVGARRFA